MSQDVHWLIDWLIDYFPWARIDWLIDWLIDCLHQETYQADLRNESIHALHKQAAVLAETHFQIVQRVDAFKVRVQMGLHVRHWTCSIFTTQRHKLSITVQVHATADIKIWESHDGTHEPSFWRLFTVCMCLSPCLKSSRVAPLWFSSRNQAGTKFFCEMSPEPKINHSHNFGLDF